MPRVLLILPSATYRAPEFLEAAATLGVDVVCASNSAQALSRQMGERFVELDLDDPRSAADAIAEHARLTHLDAVVGVDDQGLLAAAIASEQLGLRTSAVEAVGASRDKVRMRQLLATAQVAQPAYEIVTRGADSLAERVGDAAERLGYPCVVKPSNQAASRGVIRCDDEEQVHRATRRIDAMLASDGDGSSALLVERFVPGEEIAIEGLLRTGCLEVLAHFDKPDPLDGPYFEETIYLTPSRHDRAGLDAAELLTQRACAAIGLTEGPVHAEIRLPGAPGAGAVLIEVAARTIGGRCAKVLSFARGASLESIVLAHALGLDEGRTPRPVFGASGVMMLPISSTGRLVAIEGRADALAVPHITDLEISIPIGRRIEALPEGNRYLGFLFARAGTPAEVEAALRTAHAYLEVRIEPLAAADAGQAA